MMLALRNRQWYSKAVATAASAKQYRETSITIKNVQTLPQLEKLIFRTPRLNAFECSFAAYKMGKLQCKNPIAINKVLEAMPPVQFKPWQLANICYGIAKGRLAPRIPFSVVTKVKEMDLALCDSQSISTMMWSFAKLNQFILFDRFRDEINQRDFKDFKPQGISNAMWALAEQGKEVPEILAKLDKDEIALQEFNSLDISNLFWSVAKLCGDLPPPRVIFNLADMIKAKPESLRVFSPQALSNILWSCARMDFRDVALCQSIVKEMQTRDFHTWVPQDFANTVWALGKLHQISPNLLSSISAYLANDLQRLQKFPMTSLFSLLHGFALCSHRISCKELASEIYNRTPQEFDIRIVSTVLWSLQALNYKDVALCKKLAELAVENLHTCSSQILAQIAINFAKLDYRHDALLCALATELCRRGFVDFSGQAVLNILWAFACLDALRIPQVRAVFNLRVSTETRNHRTAQQAFQLRQTMLAWKIAGFPASLMLQSLAGDGEWVKEFVTTTAIESSSSQMHGRISTVLKTQFPDLINEHVLKEGLVVDIYIPSYNMVIEIDGPAHVFHNNGEMDGSTKFKQRLLRGLGYRFASLQTQELIQLSQLDFILFIRRFARNYV